MFAMQTTVSIYLKNEQLLHAVCLCIQEYIRVIKPRQHTVYGRLWVIRSIDSQAYVTHMLRLPSLRVTFNPGRDGGLY